MNDASEVVNALASCRKAIQLYPPTHPAHAEALDALVGAVGTAAASGSLVLNLYQGHLYHESVALPPDVHGASVVAGAFEDRQIESLTFLPGMTKAEAIGITEVLSLKPSPDLDVAAELEKRGVTHVVVSVLKGDDEEKAERDRQREADRAMYQRLVGALRTMREKFAAGGTGDLASTAGMVTGIIERMSTDPSAVLGLATIRGVGEHNLFHSLNVMIYAVTLGQKLGLTEEELSSLGLSALLHDVGKAAFDAEDPAQADAMRMMHPRVGAEILQRLAMDDPAPMLVAYEHHMHADGTGWPERDSDYLAHPFSRMVLVADRYENLTNPTDGADPLTPDRAVLQILREANTVLDDLFARLFANAVGAFPVGCLVRLSDQTVGVVARPGDDPLMPVVRVAYDERGIEIEEPFEVDLGASDLSILEVIDPEVLRLQVADKLV